MDHSTHHPLKQTLGVGALLALPLFALVIEAIPVLHTHAGAEPALYNEECPLAGLAARPAGASLPSTPSTVTLLIVGETPDLPVAPVPPSAVLSSADPRAPPAR